MHYNGLAARVVNPPTHYILSRVHIIAEDRQMSFLQILAYNMIHYPSQVCPLSQLCVQLMLTFIDSLLVTRDLPGVALVIIFFTTYLISQKNLMFIGAAVLQILMYPLKNTPFS